MPRKGRGTPDGRVNNGGARQGTPGKTYGNRSDLRMPSNEYGQGVRLERAQQAVPMAQVPPTTAPPAAPTGAPGATSPALPFNRPSERPSEPLTTGIPSGAGAGPEALARPGPDPELEAMRPYLPTLELLASQPTASPTARMFVRRLRGLMPPAAQ